MGMNKDLRAQWKAAGYSSRMGSAEVVPPPSKELVRAYHFMSAEFAIADIAFGRMKVARFSDLNDPFELLALGTSRRRVRRAMLAHKNTYDSDTGLLCFSANWTSPVLWSHYGAKQRGVCLGFNLPRKNAQTVLYQDRPLRMNLDESNSREIGSDLRNLLRRTKFRHWEYEQEIRVFVRLRDAIQEGALHFYRFGPGLDLVEVILGPECTLQLDAVRRLVEPSYPRVTAFKSRLAYKAFAAVPDEASVSTYQEK